jgi:hypothetical protein
MKGIEAWSETASRTMFSYVIFGNQEGEQRTGMTIGLLMNYVFGLYLVERRARLAARSSPAEAFSILFNPRTVSFSRN